MKIQFDKNQQYQLDAVQAVVDVFEGQKLATGDFEFSLSETTKEHLLFNKMGIGNNLTISVEQILENLKKVQQTNDIELSGSLEKLSFKDDEGKTTLTDFPNISVEMETGTGKTYVYLRTIYELNKVYGFTKFVIVVPSVPIREGTVKNLQITHEHFQDIYGNVPAKFELYDSKRIANLSNFARSNTIQILVINIDSFAKDQNVINQVRERGVKPIEYLQATHPIVIVDEPQRMETEVRKQAISNLNPLFTLRYSATHKNLYNLIYKLDPVKAYDLGLVKQIEVDSVLARHDNGGAFVSLDSFKLAKKSLSVVLTILKNENSGVVKKSVIAKNGDNLYQLSSRVEAYKDGYVINMIDSEEEIICFSSGTTLYKGQPQGGMNDEIQKEMIRATIENHLKKEAALNPIGIKVLSIFFIDKVANYRGYNVEGTAHTGKFADWFEELFLEAMQNPKYKKLYPYEVAEMHEGYFSQDKGKFKDSSEGRSTKADDEAYQLIMRDKERLLDNTTPLRFIFSHSALREGWDNPNVFQICTLNESKSEMRKRQEIGRGLRLCVTQTGERNTERSVNCLTVIANESYEDFANSLQKEIQEECGVSFKGRVKDARTRKKVELKKNWALDEHFLDLWDRIKYKTDYNVKYSTQNLIQNAGEAVKNMPSIPKPQIHRERNLMTIVRDERNELVKYGGEMKASKDKIIDNIRYDIPDFIGYIQSKTELTRDTVSSIILDSGRMKEIFNNPQLFMDSIVKVIRKEFDKLKVNGIKYEKIGGEFYDMQLFESEEIESYLDNLKPVKKEDKTLYNYILIDSHSTPEEKFMLECESREDVLFYIKLPSWFIIRTPIGNYNPDWALIKQEDGEQKKIYFVTETKDSKSLREGTLRESEKMKIHCGRKHFEEFSTDGVIYKAVGSLTDL